MRRTVVLGLLACSACFDALGSFEPSPEGGTSAAGGKPVDVDGALGGAAPGGFNQGGHRPEDCTNGVDDDDNGVVDCEDFQSCGGYFCAELPGDPWLGPIVLHTSADDPACGPAFPDPGPAGALIPAADNPCGCSCATSTNQTCTGSISAFTDSACATGGTSAIGPAPVCVPLSSTASSASLELHPIGGTCGKSSAPEVVVEAVTSCAASAGTGCGPGFGCVRPAEPGQTVCIYQRGAIAPCPGIFSTRQLLLQNPSADLSCTAGDCSCESPMGGECTGSATLKSGGCASAAIGVVGANAGCVELSPSTSFTNVDLTGSASGGTCEPHSRADVSRFGEVTTLCCSDEL